MSVEKQCEIIYAPETAFEKSDIQSIAGDIQQRAQEEFKRLQDEGDSMYVSLYQGRMEYMMGKITGYVFDMYPLDSNNVELRKGKDTERYGYIGDGVFTDEEADQISSRFGIRTKEKLDEVVKILLNNEDIKNKIELLKSKIQVFRNSREERQSSCHPNGSPEYYGNTGIKNIVANSIRNYFVGSDSMTGTMYDLDNKLNAGEIVLEEWAQMIINAVESHGIGHNLDLRVEWNRFDIVRNSTDGLKFAEDDTLRERLMRIISPEPPKGSEIFREADPAISEIISKPPFGVFLDASGSMMRRSELGLLFTLYLENIPEENVHFYIYDESVIEVSKEELQIILETQSTTDVFNSLRDQIKAEIQKAENEHEDGKSWGSWAAEGLGIREESKSPKVGKLWRKLNELYAFNSGTEDLSNVAEEMQEKSLLGAIIITDEVGKNPESIYKDEEDIIPNNDIPQVILTFRDGGEDGDHEICEKTIHADGNCKYIDIVGESIEH